MQDADREEAAMEASSLPGPPPVLDEEVRAWVYSCAFSNGRAMTSVSQN